MHRKSSRRLSTLGYGGLLAVNSLVFGQSYAGTDTDMQLLTSVRQDAPELPPIVVVGKRASLISAQELKQELIEIADSVIAENINKLPDFNVTDALSRVTGVQILRDRGEGSGVAIRGLTQMEATLNGREVFTAGVGRSINFADVPSEMLARMDVYKSSAADHLDGGLSGTIDTRQRQSA